MTSGDAALAGFEVRTIPAASRAGSMRALVRPGTGGGLAIVLHGRNGAARQAHMVAPEAAAAARGFTTLAPDLCNSSANDSPGDGGGFTIGGHVADAAGVLEHARQARAALGWRASGCLLIGHSMGAFAALRLAADAPDLVMAVLALSPARSGGALIEARRRMGGAALDALETELPGALEEWSRHDLARFADRVRAPVAVVSGADDTLTPPEDVARIPELVPDGRGTEIVPDQHHCPDGPAWRAAIDRALDRLLA